MLERERSKKIIDELLNYFYFHEMSEIKIAIDFTKEGFYIEIQGESLEQPDDLDMFAQCLDIPRNRDMEEYYEELLGSSHHDCEDYHLLGIMIDDAEILYDAPIFDVKIFRKKYE